MSFLLPGLGATDVGFPGVLSALPGDATPMEARDAGDGAIWPGDGLGNMLLAGDGIGPELLKNQKVKENILLQFHKDQFLPLFYFCPYTRQKGHYLFY